MTNKQLTLLVKKTVADVLTGYFSDPDFGKKLKKGFLVSLEKARNEKGPSLTLKQFRNKHGF